MSSPSQARCPSDPYHGWYHRFLSSQFHKLSPELKTALATLPRGEDGLMFIYDRFLKLLDRTRLHLAENVSPLALEEIASRVFQPFPAQTEGSPTSPRAQLVFIAVGLISLLYPARLSPRNEFLQLNIDPSRQGIWRTDSCPTSDPCLREPLLQLVHSFLAESEENVLEECPESNHPLRSSNVSYYALRTLADVTLEPTESVTEHLVLDVNLNRLKIFRFPSFCVLMCTPRGRMLFDSNVEGERDIASSSSHLQQFFEWHFRTSINRNDNSESPRAAQTFYREILLTYRIIFGQDSHSWKKLARSPSPHFIPNLADHDPLLDNLMTMSWRKQPIYTEIRAGPVKAVYSPSDFPYFASRLQILQDFVSTQSPDNLWTLVRDRRDINRLWTIRASLVFGLGAVFLGLVQIGVGIAQVVTTR
ncbi:hypothetical protein FQN55_007064 [Onygenales sp. PD_40]|nr:hypothetical protein FQN55_007064 [Onygenales sp. PD_40]KAK2783758.1 hypothetical protein FQN52_009502 [Onygenales sp. PD_12]